VSIFFSFNNAYKKTDSITESVKGEHLLNTGINRNNNYCYILSEITYREISAAVTLLIPVYSNDPVHIAPINKKSAGSPVLYKEPVPKRTSVSIIVTTLLFFEYALFTARTAPGLQELYTPSIS